MLEQEPVSEEKLNQLSDSVSADPGHLINKYRAFHAGCIDGLGGSAARVVAALSREPTAKGEVLARTRMDRKTVAAALGRLQAEEVVKKLPCGGWILFKDFENRLVEVAAERNLTSRVEILKCRHEAQRRAWAALWKGWAKAAEEKAQRLARRRPQGRRQQQWCIRQAMLATKVDRGPPIDLTEQKVELLLCA